MSYQMESALDHIFGNYQVNIMQSCDQCNSYIWVMEKAYMCSCELTTQPNFFFLLRQNCEVVYNDSSSCINEYTLSYRL